MRVEQDFTVGRPPGEVFAYMTDPANLASSQRRGERRRS
jgi:carbon monoxide dehydrogenase subunit G